MKGHVTQRGFGRFEFVDSYGAQCSIQESSSDEPRIWLGINRPDVKRLTGVPGVGWVDVELPEGAEVFGRMHLNREHVAELIPMLQHFVDTGRLPNDVGIEEDDHEQT